MTLTFAGSANHWKSRMGGTASQLRVFQSLENQFFALREKLGTLVALLLRRR